MRWKWVEVVLVHLSVEVSGGTGGICDIHRAAYPTERRAMGRERRANMRVNTRKIFPICV